MVAAVQGHRTEEEGVARWNLRRRLKRALRVRRERRAAAIFKRDSRILARANTAETLLSDVPASLSEAYPVDPAERDGETRAIVITECTGAFNMIGCNKAWENLCGYAESEIVGKDSSILQGPETNHIGERSGNPSTRLERSHAMEVIRLSLTNNNFRLVHNSPMRIRMFEEEKPVRVVTTNYRKNGSKFTNLLTLGPIRDEDGKMTHCVAVLKDITRWSSRRW